MEDELDIDDRFFRSAFGNRAIQNYRPSSDRAAFHDVFNAASAGAGGLYKTLIIASVFIALITFTAYAIMMMTSSGGRARDESKKKVMNGCLAVCLVFAAFGLVATVYTAAATAFG